MSVDTARALERRIDRLNARRIAKKIPLDARGTAADVSVSPT